MIDHISTPFTGLQSEVASARTNDGGDKSHNPPKGPGLVEGQSNNGSARRDNSKFLRPFAQFHVPMDEIPCFRHPFYQVVDLVVAGDHGYMRRRCGENQYECSKLWQRSPPCEDSQNGKQRSQKNQNDRNVRDCGMERIWDFKHRGLFAF
jgi:hypothetical protein